MDINLFRGLITLALLMLFIGLVFWAFSSKRSATFKAAELLPLAEDGDVSDGRSGDSQ